MRRSNEEINRRCAILEALGFEIEHMDIIDQWNNISDHNRK
jgi:hypothetical protein